MSDIWGRNRKGPLLEAAFLNSLRTHYHEMDDVHTKSKAHIGAVVIPAAWSMAEYLGRSGRELIEAVVCGYEIEARVAMSFGVSSHRDKGWHVTGTAGTFGAAAACGKLLGLNQDQLISAFGIAGLQSSGLWGFLGDGANCKSINPARATECGIESALLAWAGMTGPSDVLTVEDGGLFSSMTDAPEPDYLFKGVGDDYEILHVDTKLYPSCRSTHGTIDLMSRMRKNHKIDPTEIRRIFIGIYKNGFKQCGYTESCLNPRNMAEAKFSLPYFAARTLLYGDIGMDDYDEKSINDIPTREIMKKIHVYEDEELTKAYPENWGTKIAIIMKDGTEYSDETRNAKGSKDYPALKKEIEKKIMRHTDKETMEIIRAAVESIERADRIPVI